MVDAGVGLVIVADLARGVDEIAIVDARVQRQGVGEPEAHVGPGIGGRSCQRDPVAGEGVARIKGPA